jgi:hypothetical protein
MPVVATDQSEPVNMAESISRSAYDPYSQPVLDRPANQRPPSATIYTTMQGLHPLAD